MEPPSRESAEQGTRNLSSVRTEVSRDFRLGRPDCTLIPRSVSRAARNCRRMFFKAPETLQGSRDRQRRLRDPVTINSLAENQSVNTAEIAQNLGSRYTTGAQNPAPTCSIRALPRDAESLLHHLR